jgi:membrane-associated protein
MELLMFTFKDLLNPEFYILNGGLWVMLFIIFAETGLFAGFFLPGDSLLFVAGIYSNTLITIGLGLNLQNEFLHLLILTFMVTLCGVAGNFLGYWFGRKSGPALYKRKDSLLFKQKYLERAHEFYDKRGSGTIFVARFLPIIRTFAPIVAGIVQMDRKKFAFYNIVGCIAWTVSMLFAGHYLDKLVNESFGIDLKKHLEVIVLSIIFVTTAPVIAKLFFSRKK